MTQGDAHTQLTVIGQLKNIKKGLPDSQIEVVCHGQGLDMLRKATSKVAQHLEELQTQLISFRACQHTMDREKVNPQDLVKGIEPIPSALVQIILKQQEGWAYLKGGH